jgi:hypothetical protein
MLTPHQRNGSVWQAKGSFSSNLCVYTLVIKVKVQAILSSPYLIAVLCVKHATQQHLKLIISPNITYIRTLNS